MSALKIVMLGPSGAGKTALLASMSDSFQQQNTPLVLKPTSNTQARLGKHWKEALHTLNSTQSFTSPAAAFLGTIKPELYEFSLGLPGDDSGFHVEIVDIRGGMVCDQSSELLKQINECHVIFHVVDSVPLMTQEGEYAKSLHSLSNVVNLIKQRDRNKKLMIVTILTKCEKWLHQNSERQLVERFEERFQPLHSLTNYASNWSHKLVAVETFGCIEFSRYDAKQNMVFVKVGKTVRPRGRELPLQLAISHLFEIGKKNESWFPWFVNWLTGRDRALQQAFRAFTDQTDYKSILKTW